MAVVRDIRETMRIYEFMSDLMSDWINKWI